MLNVKEKQTTGTLTELYHTDYYTWAMTNSELLKEGKFDKVDYINLAEEVKDLGKSEYYKLESYLANLLSHLYKWDNQPELRSKSWKITIAVSIRSIKRTLEDNPGLKNNNTLDKAFIAAWDEALGILAKDIQDDKIIGSIPDSNPYSFKEAVEKASEITGIQNEDVFFLKNLF
ncbi:MAG: DUF29 domain-containing protein [bacterium]